MTPTPSDIIRTRLAFAYEAAETEEDRAWVNEGQEALALMEAEVERLRKASIEAIALLDVAIGGSTFTRPRTGQIIVHRDRAEKCLELLRQAIAQPGDAA